MHKHGDPHDRALRRRVSRLRRAPSCDSGRGADGHASRPTRHRRAGVPSSQCAAPGRRDRHRPSVGRRRGPGVLPRRVAARLGDAARQLRCLQRTTAWPVSPGRGYGLHVVRHRQHQSVQPVLNGDRATAGRALRAVLRRARHRPGVGHDHAADRRRDTRRAGRGDRSGCGRYRSDAGRRQDQRLAADVRLRQRRPPRRRVAARRSCCG